MTIPSRIRTCAPTLRVEHALTRTAIELPSWLNTLLKEIGESILGTENCNDPRLGVEVFTS
ncbi:Hypothetical protein FKW44_004086, partial [Caligus rogercresseyi]